jgi:hypothetical protein
MADRGDYADIGWGITLTWDGDTWRVLSVDGVGEEADSIEKTHSGSTDARKEFFAGLVDAGEVSVEVNFDPDNALVVDRTTRELVVTFPPKTGQSTGAKWTCDAFVMSAPSAGEVADRMTQSATWKLTGVPTWTPGS